MSSAGEVGCSRRVQVQPRLLWGEGKLFPSLLFVKCQGCGSNYKVLIRPSNSDVSAKLWKRFSWTRVVWGKHIIEGPKLLIPRCICTYARTHWCGNRWTYRSSPSHPDTHWHTGTHDTKTKTNNSQTNWNGNFSKLEKSNNSPSRRAKPEFPQGPPATPITNYWDTCFIVWTDTSDGFDGETHDCVPPHFLQSAWLTHYVSPSWWFPRSVTPLRDYARPQLNPPHPWVHSFQWELRLVVPNNGHHQPESPYHPYLVSLTPGEGTIWPLSSNILSSRWGNSSTYEQDLPPCSTGVVRSRQWRKILFVGALSLLWGGYGE